MSKQLTIKELVEKMEQRIFEGWNNYTFDDWSIRVHHEEFGLPENDVLTNAVDAEVKKFKKALTKLFKTKKLAKFRAEVE